MEQSVSINDFFPPFQPTLADFYPEGMARLNGQAPIIPFHRKIGPDAAAILRPLLERLRQAADTEIELLTIMEFCQSVLSAQGIKFHITRVSCGTPARRHTHMEDAK